MSLEMPMRQSELSEEKKEIVKQGVADAAGVPKFQVRIVSVQAHGGVRRRQLQDSITLEMEIFASDSQAAASVVQRLTVDTINAQMNKVREHERTKGSQICLVQY